MGFAFQPRPEIRQEPLSRVLGDGGQPLRHLLFATPVRQRIEMNMKMLGIDGAPHLRRIGGARAARHDQRCDKMTHHQSFMPRTWLTETKPKRA